MKISSSFYRDSIQKNGQRYAVDVLRSNHCVGRLNYVVKITIIPSRSLKYKNKLRNRAELVNRWGDRRILDRRSLFCIDPKCAPRRKGCALKVYPGPRVVVNPSTSLMCILGVSGESEIGRVWDFFQESIVFICDILDFNMTVMNFYKWPIRRQ